MNRKGNKMYNKINNELNSILEKHKDELNSIIENYIVIKTMIYTIEVFEIMVNIIQQRKWGDKVYKKIFDLINNEINSILVDKPKNELSLELNKNTYELKKIEIRGNKVKFVFVNLSQLVVKVINYELQWFGSEVSLKYKNDYLKPYTDKYLR